MSQKLMDKREVYEELIFKIGELIKEAENEVVELRGVKK